MLLCNQLNVDWVAGHIEEVTIPPPDTGSLGKADLVPVTMLPDWAQLAFQGTKSLNRVSDCTDRGSGTDSTTGIDRRVEGQSCRQIPTGKLQDTYRQTVRGPRHRHRTQAHETRHSQKYTHTVSNKNAPGAISRVRHSFQHQREHVDLCANRLW